MPSISIPQLSTLLVRAAVHGAIMGYSILMKGYGSKIPLISKGGVDSFTSLDRELEKQARDFLMSETGIPCFGEEDGGSKDSEWLWILDKIDGTPNWHAGVPLFGSAVALAYKDTPRLNAIMLPAIGELYLAVAGAGCQRFDIQQILKSISPGLCAFGIDPMHNPRMVGKFETALSEACLREWERKGECHNSQYIKTTSETDPKKLIIAADISYEARARKLSKVAGYCQEVFYSPMYGSASYSMCAVASGKLGGYFISGVDINDLFPGVLLVAEAGGVVLDIHGKPLNRKSTSLISAANQSVHSFMLERIVSAKDYLSMPYFIDPIVVPQDP